MKLYSQFSLGGLINPLVTKILIKLVNKKTNFNKIGHFIEIK